MPDQPNATPGANGEQQQGLSQELIDLINAATSSQVKRHLKDVVTTQSLKSMFEEFRSSFPQPQAVSDEKPSDEVTTLKKRLEEVARKNEEVERRYIEAQERVQQAERKRAEDKARADLRHLISGGLDPKLKVKDDLLDVAIGYLVDSKKVLKFDEEGNVSMTVHRSLAKGLEPEPADLPLSQAVSEWFKSPESRTFVSAQPLPGGSGQRTNARLAAAPVVVPAQNGSSTGGLAAGVARFMENAKARGIDFGNIT